MTTEEILNHCLSKPGAYIDLPFGGIPVCVKVGGRLFAQMYPREGGRRLTLNCDALTGRLYRSRYPDDVARGYHCPPALQPYFNTVRLDQSVPDGELLLMIDHSYSRVVGKLPKRIRKELESEANSESDNQPVR